MKQLTLLRHAKSSWADPELDDHQRPLNARGTRAAKAMGEFFSQFLELPLIHYSPACRSRQTLEGLIQGWPQLAQTPHQCTDTLYTFSSAVLLDWIRRQPDSDQSLFVIGHNPALLDCVHYVAPEFDCHKLPTAGWVELTLAIDHWQALSPDCGKVTRFQWPKRLSID
ncbi:SixA phosphatase family protein [Paraferrimonas sedimenticola]|uniref:Phosphohistidine phosphatase n=1 Tax=Paraferrimonas sedimenticola TaxID=375674 RepID=A0AA37RUL7_9GAMM|nr:histidine phosphatase family protein [Paraferrimonas sedimenticola]GLP95584.1 phosphohistidine phosphatase [Paraferrimonas sedimenticola]